MDTEHAIERSEEPRDPRKNAPARICDLPREEMLKALYARDKGRREAYMRMYREPPQPSRFARLLTRITGRAA